MLSRARVPLRVGALAGALLMMMSLGACEGPEGEGPEPVLDAGLSKVLGAIPPEVAARGVFVYDPSGAQDLFPGTFAGADLAVALSGAEWVAESGVPPVVVAAGVDGSEVPEGAQMVDGLLIAAAEPREARVVAHRAREGAEPVPALRGAEGPVASLVWAGPAQVASSAAAGLGDALIAVDGDTFELQVEASDPQATAAAMTEELASGGIPSSPGRTWAMLLDAADVSEGSGSVRLRARIVDLPALLLRQLIDTRALVFLTAG